MKRALLFLTFILTLAVPAHAGTTGGLSGTVTDAETHAPVAAPRIRKFACQPGDHLAVRHVNVHCQPRMFGEVG